MTTAERTAALARLEVHAKGYSIDQSYCVEYRGLPADLIGAGVCTPDLLTPAQPGRKRRTAAGHHYRRSPADWQGRQTIRLVSVPVEVAESMPGVPRTWRSLVWPLLELPPEVEAQFRAESGKVSEFPGRWAPR